jgi:hypothetical protein
VVDDAAEQVVTGGDEGQLAALRLQLRRRAGKDGIA